jgi:hypothetical protein
MSTPDERLTPELDRVVRRLTAEDDLETHPAATALLAYDEEPQGLAPRTREWIAEHIETCLPCAAALAAVPPLGMPSTLLLGRPWPMAAAAGWLAAAVLVGFLATGGEARETLLPAQSLVLSTTRGGPVPVVREDVQVLRLHLVLAEEVAVGARLDIRIVDAGGGVVWEGSETVRERDEWDWPVLTFDLRSLPRGAVKLHVRPPAGPESVFDLGL